MTNQAAVETVNEFDFISYGLNVARRVRENLERQWNPQPETENTATVSEATPDPVTAELAGLINKAPTTTTMITTLIYLASDVGIIPDGVVEFLGDEAIAKISAGVNEAIALNLIDTHGFSMDMLTPVKDALLSGKLNVGDIISKVVAANKTTTGTVEDAIGDAVKDILGDTEADPKPTVQVRKMPPKANRKPN